MGNYPKKGLQAILESNAPVGAFAKHKDYLDSLYIVNDTDGALGECELTWIITETLNGELVEKGSVKAEVPADSRVMVKKPLRKNTEKARSGTLH